MREVQTVAGVGEEAIGRDLTSTARVVSHRLDVTVTAAKASVDETVVVSKALKAAEAEGAHARLTMDDRRGTRIEDGVRALPATLDTTRISSCRAVTEPRYQTFS